MSENPETAGIDEADLEQSAYLNRFRRSHKGNPVLRGWITDTQAEGQPSSPFQLVVFTAQGDYMPSDRWTWGIVIDPSPLDQAAEKDVMEYASTHYPDANTAALAARAQLLAGGLVISNDAPALVGIRTKIRAAANRRKNDGRRGRRRHPEDPNAEVSDPS